ncbi:hypothetical protein [Siphonobacter sp. SORGH_AS_0500]|uniref:hypothetical protein n=1 Tax=Siphonobacter sp. SORGH_AS_0500 TaxID=1864824 RepID=UPI00285B1773|nr:hypothetical protein [Siphonobacter sp. SORGH_AS_0500]MDR6194301.1 outer membrane protein W [Siphonobacter sp. SORGH_AS_0500]
MKKIPLLTLLLGLSAPLFAQTSEGNRFMSYTGNLSFSGSKTASDLTVPTRERTYDINLEFSRGKFIRDNVAHGWNVGLGYNHYKILESDYASSTPFLSANYLIRRYVVPSERVRVFAQGTLGASYRPSIADGEITLNTFGAGASLGLGLTYFYKKNWAWEATANLAGLNVTHARKEDEKVVTNVQLNGSFGVSSFKIGLAHYFGSSSSAFEEPPQQSLYAVGTGYLAADLSTLHTSYPMANTTGVGVGFSGGKFVSPRKLVGIGLHGSYATANSSSENVLNSWGANVRPFVEYYWPIAGKWSIFVNSGIALGYNSTKTTDTDGKRTNQSYSAQPNIRPGIQYQLTTKWAIAAMIGNLDLKGFYASKMELKQSNTTTTNTTFNFEIDPTYQLNTTSLSLRFYPGR